MIEITNIKVSSLDADYLDVFFDVVPTYEDISSYSFVVERSDAEYGPFSDLTGPFRDKYHVRDTTIKNRSMFTKVYYRVRVTKLDDSTTALYPKGGNGICLGAPADLIALEIARNHRFKLKTHAGRVLWLFPRKRTGQHCSCFDTVMQRTLRSGCRTCFGTSWVGGYQTPVQIYGQISDSLETTQKSYIGEITVDNAMASLPNFPEVFPGDVLIEKENSRWRIGNDAGSLKKTHHGRALVKQEAPIHRIPTSDIEYSLPLNLENAENFNASPARNFTNPQNLDSDKTLDSALGFFMGNASGHG